MFLVSFPRFVSVCFCISNVCFLLNVRVAAPDDMLMMMLLLLHFLLALMRHKKQLNFLVNYCIGIWNLPIRTVVVASHGSDAVCSHSLTLPSLSLTLSPPALSSLALAKPPAKHAATTAITTTPHPPILPLILLLLLLPLQIYNPVVMFEISRLRVSFVFSACEMRCLTSHSGEVCFLICVVVVPLLLSWLLPPLFVLVLPAGTLCPLFLRTASECFPVQGSLQYGDVDLYGIMVITEAFIMFYSNEHLERLERSSVWNIHSFLVGYCLPAYLPVYLSPCRRVIRLV